MDTRTKYKMDKEINNNGYDYVDLGLPSGTLWATCNVGSSKPTDFGLYFQWGDTQGYTADQVGLLKGKKKFALDWGDYKLYPSGDGNTFTKYTNRGDTLDLEDDAAHVHMGGSWHMPTIEQIQELIDNTKYTWRALNGVNGMTFTSKKDPSKSIFIPAAGDAFNGSIVLHRYAGCVWSSMLNESFSKDGKILFFSEGGAYLNDYCLRCHGISVRGVIDKNNDNSKGNKNNMEDKLNLVEILKDVPKGTKLWSPICGKCKFVEILEERFSPIKCEALEDRTYWLFRSDGTYASYEDSECLLFPSKYNRDWSTFKDPKTHKEFELNQKVLVGLPFNNQYIWKRDIYLNYDKSTKTHCTFYEKAVPDSLIIPYDKDKDGKQVPIKYYISSLLDNDNLPKLHEDC